MGWAKYYEDNVSICIGRMAVKGYIPVNTIPVSAHRFDSCIEGVPVRPTFEHNNTKVATPFEESIRNGRRGLELTFTTFPGIRICRKLQLNGWWWSKAKKCWCNLNTKVNLRYAEETANKYQAQVTIVTA